MQAGGFFPIETWKQKSRSMTSAEITEFEEDDFDGNGQQIMMKINGILCWRRSKTEVTFLTDNTNVLYMDPFTLSPLPLEHAYFLRSSTRNTDSTHAFNVRSLNTFIVSKPNQESIINPMNREKISPDQCIAINTRYHEVFITSIEKFTLFQLIEHVLHDIKNVFVSILFIKEQKIRLQFSNIYKYSKDHNTYITLINNESKIIKIQCGNTLSIDFKDDKYISRTFADEEIAEILHNLIVTLKCDSVGVSISKPTANGESKLNEPQMKMYTDLFTTAIKKNTQRIYPANLPNISILNIVNIKLQNNLFTQINQMSIANFIATTPKPNSTQIRKYIDNRKIIWYNEKGPSKLKLKALDDERQEANDNFNTTKYINIRRA